jgi:hypothetical protein
LAKDPLARFSSVGEMVHALPPMAKTMAYRPPETRYPREQAAAAQAKPAGQPQAASAGDEPIMAQFVAGAAGAAGPMPDEDDPVWIAVRDGWRNARDSWDRLNMPTKIAVAVIGCAALAYNGQLVLGLIVPAVALYVLYRVVRSVILHHEQKKTRWAPVGSPEAARAPRPAAPQAPQPARPVPPPGSLDATTYQPTGRASTAAEPGAPAKPGDWRAASAKHWKRKSSKRWRKEAAQSLAEKGLRERLADLSGSMLLAAVVAAIMSIVAVILRGQTSVEQNQFAWLTLTSVLGSWAVLIPATFWAGNDGDQTLRRVTMLVVGLLVGAVAYLAATTLLVQFDDAKGVHDFLQLDFSQNFYDTKGLPQLPAYLAYFAAMLASIRWWRQADPLRRTRLSVWNVGAAVMAAWVVDWFWRFPQPWGLMVAAIISTSVQLAAPQVTAPLDTPAAKEKLS